MPIAECRIEEREGNADCQVPIAELNKVCILEGRAPSRPEEDGSDRAEPSKILTFLARLRLVSP